MFPKLLKGKASRQELLVEIGVEEIPSNVMVPTLKRLSELAVERLTASAIQFDSESVRVYGTPRRLILTIPHLSDHQESKTETILGPPKQAAFDSEGKPGAAAIGFSRSQGVDLSEISVRHTDMLGPLAGNRKGEYLVIEKRVEGQATEKLLRAFIPEIIAGLSFPRSMRWNGEGIAFIRPIRWIVAVYGQTIIPFSYAGVQSGNISYGHQMMAPASFPVKDFDAYEKEMRKRHVLIDPVERYQVIESQMRDLAKDKSGSIESKNQMGSDNEALILEAVHTVEFPKAICGAFDRAFLDIPQEVIITAMKEHQGYFPVFSEEGKILPCFITIANIQAETMDKIRKGNERVLRARLLDAKFYFDQDRKLKLADRVEALSAVTFQEKLGTLYEKVERLVALSRSLAVALPGLKSSPERVERAAWLCKADLLSGVVREFPSLQGVMGRIYAEQDGEDADSSKAIEEHYMPKFAGAPLPESTAGKILAMADKLDTIVGCFGVGLIPSGSQDQYALRRQGLGVIQIIVTDANMRRFSLRDAVSSAIQQYEGQDKFSVPDLDFKVIAFFKRRLDSHLQSKGVRYDLRDALLSGEIDRPWEIILKAEALVAFSNHPHFGSLITVFKRAKRILPKGFEGRAREAGLNDPAEKNLYKAIGGVSENLVHHWATCNYDKVLEELATLYAPLNQFFEDVLVMEKDEAIRQNRLSLLYSVSRLFDEFGDFSKVVEGEAVSKVQKN
ncbi:MAG: glycine--tRNA ligase subunit beta [Nitrospiria bacterium]